MVYIVHCKFGNFRENFIFANSVERHICDVENSRPGHDLPISVKDRVISAFLCVFIFAKIKPLRKYLNLQKVFYLHCITNIN